MERDRTLEAWERELTAQGYATETVTAKVGAVNRAATWADVEPWELTKEDVLGWITASERARWTRLKYLAHVRSYAAWAGIEDPTDGIRRPRQPMGLPHPVSESDLTRLLEVAKPGRETAWIILGAYAGLRAHESAKVRVGDLSSPAGVPLLSVDGKGGQIAMIPVPPIVVEQLEAAAATAGEDGRLWPGATSRAVQQCIRRVAARAGVSCSSHELRHRYGTMVYAGERDLLATQKLMRHASPTTTAGYALVAPDRLAALVGSLPGAAGPSQGPPQPDGPTPDEGPSGSTTRRYAARPALRLVR